MHFYLLETSANVKMENKLSLCLAVLLVFTSIFRADQLCRKYHKNPLLKMNFLPKSKI